MWTAIVPAYNEEKSISQVIHSLNLADIKDIIIVANGCTDLTLELAIRHKENARLYIVEFPEPLGVDMPRAVGAVVAKKMNPVGAIFVDGDMKGNIAYNLISLKQGIEKGTDMALTNCYPYIQYRSKLAKSVLKEREALNRKLGIFDKLGLATPSHGPHAISGKLLRALPPETIAIPPLSLAFAVLNFFEVGVTASISHQLLGSHARNNEHASQIAETIIGDCRQALNYCSYRSLEKTLLYSDNADGYRTKRRFDLLDNFLKTLWNIRVI